MSLPVRRRRRAVAHPGARALVGALVAVLLAAAPAAGSSYVMTTDGELLDGAAIVARVAVLSSEPGPGATTDFLVRVLEPVKGVAAGGTLRVRQLGGTDAAGRSLRIHGQTRLRPGTEAVLFLATAGDRVRPADPLLGVFRVERLGGRALAYRGLEGAPEIVPSSIPEERRRQIGLAHLPRDLTGFTAWLRDRAAGVDRPADYFLESGLDGPRRLVDSFTLLTAGDPIRWRQFDDGDDVDWVVRRGRLQRRIPSRGVDQVRAAIDAWNEIGAIRYSFAGRGIAEGGLQDFDRVNAVAFDDPNDEIAGSFDCRSGTLALGGPWYSDASYTVDGKRFLTAVGADVVFQDGLECYFASFGSRQRAGLTAAEILAHELGHTLGLGHACGDDGSPSCFGTPRLDDALMRAFVHGDDRGARIAPDDRRAALSRRGMRYPRR